MNVVILTGNVTKDPEIRQAGDSKVVKFGLAVNRPYKKNDHFVTDFFDVEVWGAQAEFVSGYVKKGMRIGVNGSVEFDVVEKDGNSRKFAKVNVGLGGRVEILERRNDTGETSASPAEDTANKEATPVASASSDDPF
jgi:single-strand DNA-binding protein